MTTNVKFRAWDTQANRYVRLDSIQFDHLGNGEPVTLKTQGVEWSIKRFVLERFTGLKDKNGREIYEGDILRVGDRVAAVQFSNGCSWFGAALITEAADRGAVVIGNVHENPELLK